MINIDLALKTILAQLNPLRSEISPASSTILGTFIAEDVYADFASPPFDKSIVDGFAIKIEDLEKHNWELPLGCEIPANANGPIELPSGTTAEIMTGAPIPIGADAVIAKEQCNHLGMRIQFQRLTCKKGMNILPMGKEYKLGELLLKAGTKITPQRAGILAACGKTSVMAQPAPRVAIISTGTELVEANMKPKGGQIRNSNGPMLVALSSVSGALPKYLGIAGDCKKNIHALLSEAESSDAIVFCGGVSAGKYDFIPEIL
ncbi:MAG: molybdopterin molybdotransferase MoeA, partial [Planctomycetota bacterium]|nr:molybdopterin molybdotransferase MoeA [Planctomycetota bacterium]